MNSLARSLATSAALCLALAAVGCGGGAELDADDLPPGSEVQADSTNPLVWIRPSQYAPRCEASPCALRVAQVVNSTKTKLVYKFDWRALSLNSAAQSDASAQVGDLLLYGRFVTARMQGRSVQVFQVVRGYRSFSTDVSDNPPTDDYYSVTAAKIACIKAPCPSLAGQTLGATAGGQVLWNDLDLGALHLPVLFKRLLDSELSAGKNLVSVDRVTGGVAHVTQVFRALDARPLE